MNEERKILINSNPGANAETTNTPGSKRFSGHRRPNANSNSNDRRFPNKGGRGGNRRNFRERPKDDFEEKVVTIRRVTKVTKGGRHFRFAAVVVVGNKKGLVGLGTGKANEVPDAIKKAVKEGKKNLIRIPMRGTTIPHEVLGNYGAGKVLIKPAKEGTGVIAGGPVRAVVELAGINDIYTKSLGSHTPINMIRAALDGLKQIQTQNTIRELRFGITPKAEVKTETKTITPTAVKVEVK